VPNCAPSGSGAAVGGVPAAESGEGYPGRTGVDPTGRPFDPPIRTALGWAFRRVLDRAGPRGV